MINPSLDIYRMKFLKGKVFLQAISKLPNKSQKGENKKMITKLLKKTSQEMHLGKRSKSNGLISY